MRRTVPALFALIALVAWFAAPAGHAQTSSYKLVPNWAKLPSGMYFGTNISMPPGPNTTRTAPPRDPAARQAQERATGAPAAPKDLFEGQGVSGLAIDEQDHIYAFNRGHKPVMIFDRDGNLLLAGADQEVNGKKIMPPHSGAVDWEGNVYVSDIEQARIVKFSPKLDRVLLQIGTTGVAGTDGTHLNRPSGIWVLRNGNIIVSDGYGNNRVAMWDKNGNFVKQLAKGKGGPDDKGTGIGEWNLPHKMNADANENLYLIDRQNYRIQVYDKDLKFIRMMEDPVWNPWDIAIKRHQTDNTAFIADHTSEQILRIDLKTAKVLDRFGEKGRGPGKFDWLHGVVIDSKDGVYAVDTYGQSLQKYIPVAATTTAQRP